ncbi:Uncharacterised protein [Vibrio cholerae]|nr:Uncharacterised protein [Vibrio cholerae]
MPICASRCYLSLPLTRMPPSLNFMLVQLRPLPPV